MLWDCVVVGLAADRLGVLVVAAVRLQPAGGLHTQPKAASAPSKPAGHHWSTPVFGGGLLRSRYFLVQLAAETP